MMKKAIILIIAMIMILFFAACGSQAVKETTENETSETTPEVISVLSATPAPTTEPVTRPSESPVVVITPTETPTPTLHKFDVDDVKMQSTPGSSCFSKIGYDSDYNILVVQFRDSGSVYIYLDYPIDQWGKFTSADSLGSWYNKHIKNKYKYERIR